MKYKVRYVPQVPMESFEVEVENIEMAIKLYETIVKLSIFEFKNKIKSDYSDAGWIQYFNEEDNEWCDIEELEGFEDWEDKLKFNW